MPRRVESADQAKNFSWSDVKVVCCVWVGELEPGVGTLMKGRVNCWLSVNADSGATGVFAIDDAEQVLHRRLLQYKEGTAEQWGLQTWC